MPSRASACAAQRTVRIAEPLQRFVEQADELMIGLAGIADAPPRRHHGASERLGPIDSARQFDRAEAGLARLREIAGLGLSLAEFAQQLRLQRLVAAGLERQRVDGVAQMLRRLLVGELPLRHARRLARIVGRKLGVIGRRAAAIMVGDLGERRVLGVERADRLSDGAMQRAAAAPPGRAS